MALKRSTLKNITLSADQRMLTLARERAQAQNRSLNDAFREWLELFARDKSELVEYKKLMKQLSHIKLKGAISRDEMNER